MLKSLEVRNFAIIDYIKLDFFAGMTVLTGETGAGKSIIVDAISLILGDRAQKEMISSKAETAEITGEFIVDSKEIKMILELNNIDYEEILTINRVISKDNKNIVKINNQVASLKTLKELANYLADIHSQFDTNQLINPENYLDLIDNFRKNRIQPLLENYQQALVIYKEKIKEHQVFVNKRDDSLKKLDLFKFQLSELANLDLKVDEYDLLVEQINVMDNIDKINTTLEKSKYLLNDEDVLSKIYEIKEDINRISRYANEFDLIKERLTNVYYELDDISSIITDRIEKLDFSKDDYEQKITRINELEKIQKKYDKNIEELIEYQNFLNNEIDQVENFSEVLEEKKKAVETAYNKLLIHAKSLSDFRKDIAKRVTKDIVDTLHELVITHALFDISFTNLQPKNAFDSSIFKLSGLDEVEFLISTNKGEPLKPLAKTASGGEMSRVMLAFKTIFARSQKIPTVIFDEIDTGISGYIAKQIARKINELAQITQVISITHIPQVVAQGKHHLAVTKQIKNNTTLISVKYLNYEERVIEIAKMVSADRVTEAAKDIAKELLTE